MRAAAIVTAFTLLAVAEPALANIRVVYRHTAVPEHARVRRALKEAKVVDILVARLDRRLALPRAVEVRFADCGTKNAFYLPHPQRPRIILCYELLARFADLARAQPTSGRVRAELLVGATFFIFLHELGHMLRHQLDLPLTGKEEDAVDQLATFLLVSVGDTGARFALAGGLLLSRMERYERVEQIPFWDQHSVGPQRLANVQCWIYGSDPRRYRRAAEGLKNRARGCPAESRAIRRAWTKLLAPHVRRG